MVEVGQIISGKYRLVRLLGDGGMGSVYEAEHLNLGTRVAIKVLHADLARRQGIAERFLQEARVSAQIRSPHVVQVTDVDRTNDGVAYLVMELLQGEPLAELLRREKKLAVPLACSYTSQILQALEAAHALGVIHRDLKPDNVFVTHQGTTPVLKLIDFGIAKLKTAQAGQTKNLTVAGMLMGTPEYMAPEQAYSAAEVDVRADIYAVGVMLYEMLSGQAPATADDPRVLILKVERGEVTPLVQAAPGIQPEIAGLVHRAMAPRPELRFSTATEMRVTLEELASGKRAGTAKIEQRGGQHSPTNAGSGPPPPHAQNPGTGPPPPNAAPALGTGTVMGAPVDAALASPMMAGSKTGTVGSPAVAAMGAFASMQPAPPMQGGMQGPPMQPAPPMQPYHPPVHSPPPNYGATSAPEKGGSGLIIGLAVIALLLGAGAVVTYVVSTQPKTQPVPPLELPTATTTVATATVTNPTATVTTPPTPVTPLSTSTVHPPPTPTNPNPPPAHKDAGAPTHPDGGAAPADAGSGQTVIVTPFGTFQFPGPRPLFYPPDQPWPPPNITPVHVPAP